MVSVFGTLLPARCSADLISTSPSRIHTYTGFSDFPSRTSKSNPANFNSGPQSPPPLDSPQTFVKGDLKHAEKLPDPGQSVPVSGPVARISLFSRLNGSIPGSSSSQSILAGYPTPPKNFLANSLFIGSFHITPLVRSTRKILPTKPNHLSLTFYCLPTTEMRLR